MSEKNYLAAVLHPQSGSRVIQFPETQDILAMCYDLGDYEMAECVDLYDDDDGYNVAAWCDEEGMYKPDAGITHLQVDDKQFHIYGAVIILRTNMETGETFGFDSLEQLNARPIMVAYTPPVAKNISEDEGE